MECMKVTPESSTVTPQVKGKRMHVDELKRPGGDDTIRKYPGATTKTSHKTGITTYTREHRVVRQGSGQGRGLEHLHKSTKWKKEINLHILVTSLDRKYRRGIG